MLIILSEYQLIYCYMFKAQLANVGKQNLVQHQLLFSPLYIASLILSQFNINKGN